MQVEGNMDTDINSQEAVIAFAKHLEGLHSPHIHDYESARGSLERKLAYCLHDFKSDGLLNKAKALEDFELIGCIDHLVRKEESAQQGFMHGMYAVSSTVIVGTVGAVSGGLLAGGVVAGGIFVLGTAKVAFEMASLRRSEKKITQLVSENAERLESAAANVQCQPMNP